MMTEREKQIEKTELYMKRWEERIVNKKNNYVVRATAFLYGDLGKKFLNHCLQTKTPEAEVSRKIYKFYYDNHPNPMNY